MENKPIKTAGELIDRLKQYDPDEKVYVGLHIDSIKGAYIGSFVKLNIEDVFTDDPMESDNVLLEVIF